MMFGYVLHAGYVVSKNDRQRHFIDPQTLAELYKVDFEDCVVDNDFIEPSLRKFKLPDYYINLYPRYEGDYEEWLTNQKELLNKNKDNPSLKWHIQEVNNKSNCLHDNCTMCTFTHVKVNGEVCIHLISCPCDRCNTSYIS